MLRSEASLRLKLNGFEDGLNHTIDRLTYEILQEYREGVDMAQQLMEPPLWETLNSAATRLDDHRYESDGVT